MVLSGVIFLTLSLLTTCSCMPSDGDTIIEVPESCRGKQYCPHKPKGYELLEEKMDLIMKQILKKDESKRLTRSIKEQEEDFLPIISPKSDWHNCPYRTQNQSLYLAEFLDEDEVEMKLIIQTKANRQIFNIVTCARDLIPYGDGQCFRDLQVAGMKSTCEEIYSKRNVYVYNVKKMKIEVKYLSLPFSCSCKVSHDANTT